MKSVFLTIALSLLAIFSINAQTFESKLDSIQKLTYPDPELADSLAKALLQEVQLSSSDELLPRIYANLGMINYVRGRYQLSNKHYKDALTYLKSPDNAELIANIQNNLGINYELTDQFEEAIEVYLQSLDFALSIGDSTSIHQSYLNLGLSFAKIGDYDESEKYLLAAYDYFSGQGDPFYAALALQNLGFLNISLKKNETARENFLQAIELMEDTDNLPGLASLYNDYLYYLLTIEDFVSFEAILPEYRSILNRMPNDYIDASSYVLLGNFYLKGKKAYTEAATNYLKALELLEEYETVPQLVEIYPNLIECYYQTKDQNKVKSYLEKYRSYLAKRYSEESAEKIAELRAVYELTQKESETKLLRIEIQQKNRIILFSISTLTLFLIISLITYYYRSAVQIREKALVERSIELTDLIEQEKQESVFVEDYSPAALAEDFTELQMKKLFVKIKRYVLSEEKFLDSNLKISDIAFALGTNEKYASQAIRIGSNMPFNAFINFYRINRAKKILRSTESGSISVGQVASLSGFSHQSTFQKKFKEHTGVTPYTFQRLARLNKLDEEE